MTVEAKQQTTENVVDEETSKEISICKTDDLQERE